MTSTLVSGFVTDRFTGQPIDGATPTGEERCGPNSEWLGGALCACRAGYVRHPTAAPA